MKYILTILAVFAASTAFAGSNASSSSTSGAQSVSVAGSTSGVVINNDAPSDVTVTGMGVGVAPSMASGNVCALATSFGASFLGGGFGVGQAYSDKDCVLISQAAALNSVAGKQAAIIHLASGSEAMCKSLRAAGAIAQTSLCGDAPQATPATATAGPTCEYNANGRLVKVYGVAGMSQADAIASCRR